MRRNHAGEKESDKNQEVRMELKYCERCGSLWLRECGTGEIYCESCQRIVSDLPIPKKKPTRLMLPVRQRSLIDEYVCENGNDDSLDFEAAGGAA